MNISPTTLPDVCLLQPQVFGDERGYFFEAFSQQRFAQATGCHKPFVQDNQSRSSYGVLRGLHYQIGAHPQDKLVRVLSGEIYDVAVDIRQSSATFGQWMGAYLNAESQQQLWIPAGFAHGFVVTSASADILYKVTDYYDPAGERSIRWDDPQLGIHWPIPAPPTLSAKDAAAPAFADAELFA